jgi:signal peptide peptidase SppA
MNINAVRHKLSQPWLIRPTYLDGMIRDLAEFAHNPQAVRDRKLPPMEDSPEDLIGRPTVRTSGSVAIVPITGPLYHDDGAIVDDVMAFFFGGTSYDAIAEAVNAAIEDRDVTAICLYVDSPGGQVSGCAETADIIRAAAAVKPITAYVASMGCSAAYWLASAASKIVCDPTALLGSIGVRASVIDASGAMEKAGLKQFDFVARQSPHKIADPKTEKGRQQIQAEIDALGEVFVQTMAVNRNVPVAKVLSDFGGGDVLVGKDAVKVGLADSLGSLNSVLTEMKAADVSQSKTTRKPSPPTKPKGASARGPNSKDRQMDLTQRLTALFAKAKTEIKAESLDALVDTAEAEGIDLDALVTHLETPPVPVTTAKTEPAPEATVESPREKALREQLEKLVAERAADKIEAIGKDALAAVNKLVHDGKLVPASIKAFHALRVACGLHAAGLPLPKDFTFVKALDALEASLPDHRIGATVAAKGITADEAAALELPEGLNVLPKSENKAPELSHEDALALVQKYCGIDVSSLK